MFVSGFGASAYDRIPINARFVATTGSDSPSRGSESLPYLTLNYALNQTAGNYPVVVRGGTYNAFVRFQYDNQVLMGYPGERPIIDGTSLSAGGDLILFQHNTGYDVTMPNQVMKHFEIRNYDGQGLKGYAMYNSLLEDLFIHDNRDSGILFSSGKNVDFKYIKSYHNGITSPNPELNHGVYLTGQGLNIENCLMYENGGYGMQFANYPYSAGNAPDASFKSIYNLTVNGCTVTRQDQRGGIVLYGTSGGTLFENVDIINCCIQYNSIGAGSNYGCVRWSEDGSSLDASAVATHKVDSCLLKDTNVYTDNITATPPGTDTNNDKTNTADFVNIAGDDYHVVISTSACVGLADSATIPDKDLDGYTRHQDVSGCYDRQS